ncbi:MAG: hypothetical protein NVSMB39_3210 [Candidatus Saccharimonadales bacterium]
MQSQTFNFQCQMYVGARGGMDFILPVESGPSKVARLEPLAYDKLVDPSFRRLLAAFESVPSPLQSVQV